MPETYCPDNEGLVVEKMQDGVKLIQRTQVGIDKSVEIRLSPALPAVTLTHRISNSGLEAVNLAPWALTMFRLGGTAVLPQPEGNTDPNGLLNNLSLIH